MSACDYIQKGKHNVFFSIKYLLTPLVGCGRLSDPIKKPSGSKNEFATFSHQSWTCFQMIHRTFFLLWLLAFGFYFGFCCLNGSQSCMCFQLLDVDWTMQLRTNRNNIINHLLCSEVLAKVCFETLTAIPSDIDPLNWTALSATFCYHTIRTGLFPKGRGWGTVRIYKKSEQPYLYQSLCKFYASVSHFFL